MQSANLEGRPHGALRQSLQADTRAMHVAIDHEMLQFDLSRREDYGLFLGIHFAVLEELDDAWRQEERDDFRAMRQRLRNDLLVLAIAPMSRPAAASPLPTAGHRMGAAYVIRGSRLGAAVLRRRVPMHFATSYLEFAPALPWPQFLRQLDEFSQNSNEEAALDAVRGARRVFELFASLLAQVHA